MPPSDYKAAYETAKKELADLIDTQDRIGKRILVLRESLKMLAALCDSEEIEIELSAEAEYLLENSTLTQDIQTILKSEYPAWQRPSRIRSKLGRLGHDLSKYNNPQAAIHMVLKRLADSPNDPTEETIQSDGKKAYRCPALTDQLAEALRAAEIAAVEVGKGLQEALNNQVAEAAKAVQAAEEGIRAALQEQYESVAVPAVMATSIAITGRERERLKAAKK